MDTFGEVVRGLLPTVGVSLLFAAAIWAIVRADAAERAGRARVEAEEDAADAARARGRDRAPATDHGPADAPAEPALTSLEGLPGGLDRWRPNSPGRPGTSRNAGR